LFGSLIVAKPNNVGVGVAAIIFNSDGKVLLIKRKGAHASGVWAAVGGWIDYNDCSIENAVIREIKEEVGLKVCDLKMLTVTTELHSEIEVRSVTLYFTCTHELSTKIHIMEPQKIDAAMWFNLNSLPKNLYPGLEDVLIMIK
jgi:8-oxo-dGTP diphosphatase